MSREALLAIDTTTTRAGVALAFLDGDEVTIAGAKHERVTTHSESLLPMIRDLLDGAGVRPADLAAIACAAGPGSFTGLRIGLATAKGLCFATGRPLLLVSSLATLAARAPAGASVVPCLDAFKGEVYAGFYRGGPEPTPLADEAVLAPPLLVDQIAARVAAGLLDKPVFLVGDAAARWPELAAADLVSQDREPPDPADVARLAALAHRRGQHADLASASPRYIRPSEAEIMAAKGLLKTP